MPLAAPPSAYGLTLRDDGHAAPPKQHQATSDQQINQREVGPLQAVAVGPLQAVATTQPQGRARTSSQTLTTSLGGSASDAAHPPQTTAGAGETRRAPRLTA